MSESASDRESDECMDIVSYEEEQLQLQETKMESLENNRVFRGRFFTNLWTGKENIEQNNQSMYTL